MIYVDEMMNKGKGGNEVLERVYVCNASTRYSCTAVQALQTGYTYRVSTRTAVRLYVWFLYIILP